LADVAVPIPADEFKGDHDFQSVAAEAIAPHILMPHSSGERGIARISGSASSVESLGVRLI